MMTGQDINPLLTKYLYKLGEIGSLDYTEKTRNIKNILFNIEYIPFFELDGNRIEHVRDFRKEFCSDMNVDEYSIDILKPKVSVLEVMCIVAYRIEYRITYEPEIGFESGRWVYVMLRSLGFDPLSNEDFTPQKIYEVVESAMRHEYPRTGHGGFFEIDDSLLLPGEDLRNADLWQQAMWYVSKVYYKN